jgi:hypothetical protein
MTLVIMVTTVATKIAIACQSKYHPLLRRGLVLRKQFQMWLLELKILKAIVR